MMLMERRMGKKVYGDGNKMRMQVLVLLFFLRTSIDHDCIVLCEASSTRIRRRVIHLWQGE